MLLKLSSYTNPAQDELDNILPYKY